MKYTVFYTYSPKYNRERAVADRIDWDWLSPPGTWEEYEQVRIYLAKLHNAVHVMLYTVIPTDELGEHCGAKNYMYKNGTRKTREDKPWEDHAEAEG